MAAEPETIEISLFQGAKVFSVNGSREDLVLTVCAAGETQHLGMTGRDLIGFTKYLMCWCVAAFGESEVKDTMEPQTIDLTAKKTQH